MGNSSSVFRCGTTAATIPARRLGRQFSVGRETLPVLRDTYARKMGIVSKSDQLRPITDPFANIVATSQIADNPVIIRSQVYMNFRGMTYEEYMQAFNSTVKVIAVRVPTFYARKREDAHGSAFAIKHGAERSYLLASYHTAYPYLKYERSDVDDVLCEEKDASFKCERVQAYLGGCFEYECTVVWADPERDICVMATNKVMDCETLDLDPWREDVDIDFVCLIGYRARTRKVKDSFDNTVSSEETGRIFGQPPFSRSVSCLSREYVEHVREQDDPGTRYLCDGLAVQKARFVEVQNGCLEGYSGGPAILRPGFASGVLIRGYEGSNNIVSPILQHDPLFDVVAKLV